MASVDRGKVVYKEYCSQCHGAAGKELFLRTAQPVACVMCHGEQGDGKGVMGAALMPPPRNFTCHGAGGDGKGPGGAKLNPSPRNFQHHGFWRHRTEGEVFWALIQYERTFAGSHGPGMMGKGMGPHSRRGRVDE